MSEPEDEGRRVFSCSPGGSTEIRETGDGSENEPPSNLKQRTLQAMSFSTHVVSLNAMALMHLGYIEGVDVRRDRDAAQHVVDTLTMLKAKTQGNLTPEEEKLLGSVLYDLRMKFVQQR